MVEREGVIVDHLYSSLNNRRYVEAIKEPPQRRKKKGRALVVVRRLKKKKDFRNIVEGLMVTTIGKLKKNIVAIYLKDTSLMLGG